MALDETVTAADVAELLVVFGGDAGSALDLEELAGTGAPDRPVLHGRAGGAVPEAHARDLRRRDSEKKKVTSERGATKLRLRHSNLLW